MGSLCHEIVSWYTGNLGDKDKYKYNIDVCVYSTYFPALYGFFGVRPYGVVKKERKRPRSETLPRVFELIRCFCAIFELESPPLYSFPRFASCLLSLMITAS